MLELRSCIDRKVCFISRIKLHNSHYICFIISDNEISTSFVSLLEVLKALFTVR
jgi:hypothetical protein